MSRNNWFSPLFSRSQGSAPCGRRPRLAFEPLEQRAMLTTLTVDIGDPTANDPGDNLYAQISEAVAAASEGDKIKVHAGTYDPFVVNTDNLTIREARHNSNPVVDGDLNLGDENGVEVNANGVTIRGLTVKNASGGSFFVGNGFWVTGENNTLIGNTAIGMAPTQVDSCRSLCRVGHQAVVSERPPSEFIGRPEGNYTPGPDQILGDAVGGGPPYKLNPGSSRVGVLCIQKCLVADQMPCSKLMASPLASVGESIELT